MHYISQDTQDSRKTMLCFVRHFIGIVCDHSHQNRNVSHCRIKVKAKLNQGNFVLICSKPFPLRGQVDTNHAQQNVSYSITNNRSKLLAQGQNSYPATRHSFSHATAYAAYSKKWACCYLSCHKLCSHMHLGSIQWVG